MSCGIYDIRPLAHAREQIKEHKMINAYVNEIKAAGLKLPAGYADDPFNMQVAKLQSVHRKIK